MRHTRRAWKFNWGSDDLKQAMLDSGCGSRVPMRVFAEWRIEDALGAS